MGQVFGKIRVLAKSRNRCKFIQVLLQCVIFIFLYVSKHVTSLVIRAKASINKTLWNVHFEVVVVELINCKCGGVVRNDGKSKMLICEIMGFVRIF